ncbi:MAG TPA: hypothetical protein DHV42_06435 [Lachnospiraceae bacterium]|nr:hypothetical protein [Lachnospiraceae bacterium]
MNVVMNIAMNAASNGTADRVAKETDTGLADARQLRAGKIISSLPEAVIGDACDQRRLSLREAAIAEEGAEVCGTSRAF